MAITSTIRKGSWYIKGGSGYEKLCPYATDIYMSDGTTVQTKLASLASTVSTLNTNLTNYMTISKDANRLAIKFSNGLLIECGKLMAVYANPNILLGSSKFLVGFSGEPFGCTVSRWFNSNSGNTIGLTSSYSVGDKQVDIALQQVASYFSSSSSIQCRYTCIGMWK